MLNVPLRGGARGVIGAGGGQLALGSQLTWASNSRNGLIKVVMIEIYNYVIIGTISCMTNDVAFIFIRVAE